MGFKLWSYINKLMLDSAATVLTSKGISNMIDTIKSLGVFKNDSIFCAIDNVGSRDSQNVIRWTIKDSKNRGYRLFISEYYCVEDIFLSFKELAQWLRVTDEEDKNSLKFICGSIYLKNNYFYNLTLRMKYPKARNREQLASYVLTNLSYKYSKQFRVSKGKLGKCWVEDCESQEQYPFYCKKNKCFIYKQQMRGNNCTCAKDKIETLWSKSILCYEHINIEGLKSYVKEVTKVVELYNKINLAPKGTQWVMYNDAFFDSKVSAKDLTKQDLKLMDDIEHINIIDKENGLLMSSTGVIRMDDISTGLKTLLNIRWIKRHSNLISTKIGIDITECGTNVLDYVFDEVKDGSIIVLLRHLGILGLRDRYFRINGAKQVRTIESLYRALMKAGSK